MRRLTYLAMMLFLLLLSACGTVPTESTPAAPTLNETFSSQDMLGGVLFLRYPTGWAVQADENGLQVQLASRADILTAATIPSGTIRMIINAAPLSVASAALPAGAALTPTSFLNAFLETVRQTNPSLEVGTISTSTLGGKNAAEVMLKAADGESILYAIEKEEAYIIASATTAPNEFAQNAAIIQAIAASVDYSQAAE